MNMKRILAMLLAVLMMVPVLAACQPDTPDVPDDTTPSSDSKVEDTTVPEETGLKLDKSDFGGANLRILGVSEDYNYGYYQTGDIWIETEQADPFENSVYKRLQDCIKKYNFGVEYASSTAPMDDVASLVSGGLDQYDVVFAQWHMTWAAAKTGNLLDLREIDTLNLSNSWWDQNANEQLSVANRLFYTTGDITTVDDRCTRALYFNKTLAASHDMESPYELVRTNQWTLDKFSEMCRSVYDDVNGDGNTDIDDVMGFFRESGQFNYLMTAMDEHYAQLDENGMPVYTFMQDAEGVTKMETVCALLTDEKVSYNIHNLTDFGGYSNRFAYARSKFAAGKHLFTIGGALVISEFADMEDSFGILPMPKWNADQTRYYHIVDTPAAVMGIPNTKADASDIGYMLEYFSYEGQQTVSPTFKERMLKRRYAQDSDSGDMLDIIYANKCFDVGFVANWGGILGIADGAVLAGNMPKMSAYNRALKSIPKLIQKDYDAFLNVGKDVE